MGDERWAMGDGSQGTWDVGQGHVMWDKDMGCGMGTGDGRPVKGDGRQQSLLMCFYVMKSKDKLKL